MTGVVNESDVRIPFMSMKDVPVGRLAKSVNVNGLIVLKISLVTGLAKNSQGELFIQPINFFTDDYILLPEGSSITITT